MRSASAAISSGIRTLRGPILATRPNQLWRDITKLKGPAKWTYIYLYVVLDVFSRHVVGWMVATEHRAREEALADLGVTKTHSRPHVSNDNPFSESASRR